MYGTTHLLALGIALQAFTLAAAGDDATDVMLLSESFERARITGDMTSMHALVLAEASMLDASGREPRLLRDELQLVAKQMEEYGNPPEPVRVVDRQIEMHGDTAVVIEMLGAALHPDGHKVAPRRRTLVWVRATDGWKVAHLHTSPYQKWEAFITAFEAEDEVHPPADGGVVFVGSSSVRRWQTLRDDFPRIQAIGRGFGGSQLIDSILYAHRIVTPYKPRAVAVYAGDNDIAAGKSPERVCGDFKVLVETIHAELPSARIGFIAIKPSIQRWEMWPRMKLANQLIEQLAARRELVDYVDIATPMLDSDGQPRPELFVSDGLHLTAEGYALWTRIVSPWTVAE